MFYKFMIITFFMIGFASCGDKEDTPNYSKDCNCGTVANDGIDNGCYWLELRNNCSENKKKFCVDQDKWMEAYIGSKFCITNETSW